MPKHSSVRRPARLLTGLAAGATAAALAATAAPAVAAPEAEAAKKPGNRSLVKVLAADGAKLDKNWKDFDLVERAVVTVLEAKPDSAVGVLAKGGTKLTAFIPTDAAFRALAHDLTGERPATERATWRTLAGLVDADTLETVLLYHVVPGAKINSKAAAKADGAELETAQGGTITVNVTKKGAIRLVDADTDDRNPRVLPRALDINKGNKQLAHGISQVLRPVNL
ncbi:fasciclin domain-containing protein [Nocardioides ferulae]|uniref:fasciclin domain-containing protein n=1 Tax=Nocardioides ferulae TaxID=2340821 RepID=UPI000EAC2251|nr:fasciclin domain-containing protein [Nocardioides ferulae]